MALEMHPSLTVHAGEWLRTEVVEPAGITVSGLAAHFGLSRQAVSALLNGRVGLLVFQPCSLMNSSSCSSIEGLIFRILYRDYNFYFSSSIHL